MKQHELPDRLVEGFEGSPSSPASSSSKIAPPHVATECFVEASHRLVQGYTVVHRYEHATVSWTDAGLWVSDFAFSASPSADTLPTQDGVEVFIPYARVVRVIRKAIQVSAEHDERARRGCAR